MRRIRLLCFLALLFAFPAVAAPLDPTVQAELLGLYDRYNQAMAAGKLADAVALRGPEARAELNAEMKKSARARADLLRMGQMMAPDRYEAQHASLSADGQSATIVVLGTKTVTAAMRIPGGPKPGTVGQSEVSLVFGRHDGAWKLDDMVFGMDPAEIKPCRDAAEERISAYDEGRQVSFGGPIRRVVFSPDHTLVVIRVVDEEDCAILPPREQMSRLGVRPEALVPYAMVDLEGLAHRSDTQRDWVTSITVLPEK